MVVIKEKLNKMLLVDAMGFVVRSRFHQNAEEERASLLFHAGREMNNGKKRILDLKSGGQVLLDQASIEIEVTGFFGALFNGHHDIHLGDTGQPFVPDNTDVEDLLGDLVSMERNSSDELEVALTSEEVDFVFTDVLLTRLQV